MTLPLFSQTKLEQSEVSSHLWKYTQDPQPTTFTAQTLIVSLCPLTEAEVSKLVRSSHPTTCPLDPIPSHQIKSFQIISPPSAGSICRF